MWILFTSFKGIRYYCMNKKYNRKVSKALCNCLAHFSSFSMFIYRWKLDLATCIMY